MQTTIFWTKHIGGLKINMFFFSFKIKKAFIAVDWDIKQHTKKKK